MKNILKFLLNKATIIGTLILIECLVLFVLFSNIVNYTNYAYLLSLAVSFVISILIVNSESNPSYKIGWILAIFILSPVGILLYFLFGKPTYTPAMKKKLNLLSEKQAFLFEDHTNILKEIRAKDEHVYRQFKYLTNSVQMPTYKNTKTRYLPTGEKKFEVMKQQLRKARKFILLEYFIISTGSMWDEIFDILKQKVKEGVEVKLMYDDVGVIFKLPSNYDRVLKKAGIEVAVFNPFKPFLNTYMNYRDHRKILVVDGNVAITGGINIADEYINKNKKFSKHWKDAAIMISGDAVWNFTTCFLLLWEYQTGKTIEYSKYRVYKSQKSDGYVMPYSDSPLDNITVAHSHILQMINCAKKYIYITTPYLIPDNELIMALVIAAQSEIDVRIVTPACPDKWFVHMVTRSYYKQLIKAGVKIYEYKPGFIHSKTYVSDDKVASIGTTNMDFRSLYLHFECGVMAYESSVVMDLKDDFVNMLDKCEEITLKWCKQYPWYKRPIRSILKLFAPLM